MKPLIDITFSVEIISLDLARRGRVSATASIPYMTSGLCLDSCRNILCVTIIYVLQPKKVTKKRKKVDSPTLTEDDNSDIEPLYYRPNNKTSTADKENIHRELTRTSKVTHHKTDFVSAFKVSLFQLKKLCFI